MFLRSSIRKKNGKTHRYWSIVENKRVSGGRVVQRHVLYLGEINSEQQREWVESIDVFDDRPLCEKPTEPCELLRAEFGCESVSATDERSGKSESVRILVSDMELRRPRQWGACWLACHLYEELQLDSFFLQRLPPSRKKTRWDLILKTLCCYRLISPGSEWRLHRHWFEQSAMADLLGADFSLAEQHKLYECHDRLLEHKEALFIHLQERWKDLFNARFDVLLYDLTSTYFESEPPLDENDKRRFGYSRDKRPDCVQVVIALVVTPEGFPLAYEVMAGNTSDKATLRGFLKKIETLYGKAERIWVMDRGIPTEEVLDEMRKSKPPTYYLVGTPKGRLTKLEKELAERPWREVRQDVDVKLLPKDGELYVFAQSRARICKERAMRQRKLRALLKRLTELCSMKKLQYEELLLKLGQAKDRAGNAYKLIDVQLPAAGQAVSPETFGFSLNKQKLREARRREGRYLLRSNLCEEDPAKLWEFYIQLTQVEEAFKTIKSDLSVRPIYHQHEHRIEAHIFIAFLAYCMQVTLSRRLRYLAPGLSARSVLEKFGAVQMLDVHLPTTDGRTVVLTRYTQPENDLKLLLERLKLQLPEQAPPRISARQRPDEEQDVVQTF
jgi:transposase